MEVHLGRGLPTDSSVESATVVSLSPGSNLSTEVAQRTEVDPPDELLGENPVESLELPPPLRMVRPSVDHSETLLLAVSPELLRDEAAPVVDIERLRPPSTLDGPPEIVDRLTSPLVPIGAGHHKVSRAIVQEGVEVDVPPNPGDAELVHVRLPEGVHVTALEAREGEGLPDDPNHEAMALQDPMDGPPAQLNSSAAENGVDSHRAPRGVSAPQLEDSVDEVPVDSVRTMVGSTRLVAQPLDPVLPVVVAPPLQRSRRDPEELAYLGCPDSSFEMLLDDLQS